MSPLYHQFFYPETSHNKSCSKNAKMTHFEETSPNVRAMIPSVMQEIPRKKHKKRRNRHEESNPYLIMRRAYEYQASLRGKPSYTMY